MSNVRDALAGSEDVVQAADREEKKGRSRPYGILAIVVGAILLGCLAFRFFTSGRESTDDAQVGADMVPIAARVGGSVVSVPVVDHQAVKRGDLIAQIDPADYQNRLEQANAELLAAKAQAEAADAQMHVVEASSKGALWTARAALSGSTASVAGADAQIEAAKAALERAHVDADRADTDLNRARSLRSDDAIPQAQVDTLAASAASAHASLAQAKAQLVGAQDAKRAAETRIAEAEGRVEQTGAIDAQLAAAKANADLAHARVASADALRAQAQLNLSYAKIVAPEDGHISRLAVHQGQLVTPAQMVTNLLPNTTYVIANFKETQVGRMHAGQNADVSIDAYPGRTFRAKIDRVAYGTGAQFSLLPPDNASGNFVKVVQRVPVKLVWTESPEDVWLGAGLSADVTVLTKP